MESAVAPSLPALLTESQVTGHSLTLRLRRVTGGWWVVRGGWRARTCRAPGEQVCAHWIRIGPPARLARRRARPALSCSGGGTDGPSECVSDVWDQASGTVGCIRTPYVRTTTTTPHHTGRRLVGCRFWEYSQRHRTGPPRRSTRARTIAVYIPGECMCGRPIPVLIAWFCMLFGCG